MLHRKIAGVDDLYTARSADRQLAPAGCWGGGAEENADVDDVYTARAANWQRALAGCGVAAHRKT